MHSRKRISRVTCLNFAFSAGALVIRIADFRPSCHLIYIDVTLLASGSMATDLWFLLSVNRTHVHFSSSQVLFFCLNLCENLWVIFVLLDRLICPESHSNSLFFNMYANSYNSYICIYLQIFCHVYIFCKIFVMFLSLSQTFVWSAADIVSLLSEKMFSFVLFSFFHWIVSFFFFASYILHETRYSPSSFSLLSNLRISFTKFNISRNILPMEP